MHGPSRQRAGPWPSRRAPKVVDSNSHRGRLSTEAAQTVSRGRLSAEAAHRRRRRSAAWAGRACRRQGCTALPARGAGHDPAGTPRRWRTPIHTGAACPQRQPKQCPGAACRQRRPSCDDGGRPRERDAPVDGADARPCPTEGRAAIRLAST